MIAELLKYTIPSLILLAAFFIMMRFFLRHNNNQLAYLKDEQELARIKLDLERKQQMQKVVVPLKLQAYERMVLFLERINPPNLIKRSMSYGQKVSDLQGSMLRNIRDEYEHNMSQQLYIGQNTWEMIKTAKEDVARLINTTASQFKTDDEAAKMAKKMLTSGFDAKNDPIEKALVQLKNEVKEIF